MGLSMNDTLTGLLLGFGLAAVVHYAQMMLLAHRIQSAKNDIAKLVVEHALKDEQ